MPVRAYYTYNITGMPKTVEVPAVNGTITYQYSAAGEKLSVNYAWHNGRSLDPLENSTPTNYSNTNSTKTVEYVGNKVYENGALKMILLPNGYISNNIYYFYLRNHLGNNAVQAQVTLSLNLRQMGINSKYSFDYVWYNVIFHGE